MSRTFTFVFGLVSLFTLAGCTSPAVSQSQAIGAATTAARSEGREMSDYKQPSAKYIHELSPGWLVCFKQKGIPMPDGDVVVFVDATSGQTSISHP